MSILGQKKIDHFNYFFFKYKIKVTRRLNIKENENYFFTDMININNFESSLLHIHRMAMDHDFVIYYVKYLKNSN